MNEKISQTLLLQHNESSLACILDKIFLIIGKIDTSVNFCLIINVVPADVYSYLTDVLFYETFNAWLVGFLEAHDII